MNIIRRVRFGVKTNNILLNEYMKRVRHEAWTKEPRRTFIGKTYEGDGKTTAQIINKKGSKNINITTVTESGFVLSNGWFVSGPSVFFPHTFLPWRVNDVDDVTEESLALFTVLQPKLDVLLLGFGSFQGVSRESFKRLLMLTKRMSLNIEVMATVDAAATFNFCSTDVRYAAAALIPPQIMDMHHGINDDKSEQVLIEEEKKTN